MIMGTLNILSKSSNNGYSYSDSDDARLTVNGSFELDEQEKKVLSANGNIIYDGTAIANFTTSMYNGVLQYQLYGVTAENTSRAMAALVGVQERLKAQVSGETVAANGSETGADEIEVTDTSSSSVKSEGGKTTNE
jgi:hypothetical protein